MLSTAPAPLSRAAGHPRREAALVAHHSGARFVAELRGLAPELSAFRFVEPVVTDALTCADQTTGRAGSGWASRSGWPRPSAFWMRRPASPPRGVIPTSTPPSTGRSDGSAGRRRSLRTVDTPTVGSQAPPCWGGSVTAPRRIDRGAQRWPCLPGSPRPRRRHGPGRAGERVSTRDTVALTRPRWPSVREPGPVTGVLRGEVFELRNHVRQPKGGPARVRGRGTWGGPCAGGGERGSRVGADRDQPAGETSASEARKARLRDRLRRIGTQELPLDDRGGQGEAVVKDMDGTRTSA